MLYEFVVTTFFDDLAIIEYNDAVRLPDGTESVTNYESAFVILLFENIVEDLVLGLRINRRGWFVKDQDIGISVKSPASATRCHWPPLGSVPFLKLLSRMVSRPYGS